MAYSDRSLRRRRIHPEIVKRIEELTYSGWPPPRILRQLESEPRFKKAELPNIRTVQRIFKDLTPEDDSGLWSLADAAPEEAKLVLPVLRETLDWQGHRLTKNEARWVAKIRQAAPNIDSLYAYMLARVYWARVAQKRPTDDLDAFLAFAPWEGDDQRHAWDSAVRSGYVVLRGHVLMTEHDWRSLKDRLKDWASDESGVREFETRLQDMAGEKIAKYKAAEKIARKEPPK